MSFQDVQLLIYRSIRLGNILIRAGCEVWAAVANQIHRRRPCLGARWDRGRDAIAINVNITAKLVAPQSITEVLDVKAPK